MLTDIQGIGTGPDSRVERRVADALIPAVPGAQPDAPRMHDRRGKLHKDHRRALRDADRGVLRDIPEYHGQHVQSYGGTTIKSTGDGLLFSFTDSAQRRSGRPASERALECCVAMTESYRHMAVAFRERSLEPIKYRISAAYGPVRVARIAACPGNDIFGSTVNRCAKLNCAAPTNGLVIDEDFYGNVESSEGYRFQWTQDKACGYGGYVVRRAPRFGRLGLVP